jgi:hypothetical protein
MLIYFLNELKTLKHPKKRGVKNMKLVWWPLIAIFLVCLISLAHAKDLQINQEEKIESKNFKEKTKLFKELNYSSDCLSWQTTCTDPGWNYNTEFNQWLYCDIPQNSTIGGCCRISEYWMIDPITNRGYCFY